MGTGSEPHPQHGRFTDEKRHQLEKEFHYSRYITRRRKLEMAASLHLNKNQVKMQSKQTSEILSWDKGDGKTENKGDILSAGRNLVPGSSSQRKKICATARENS
jgi:hypothetical protein